MLMYTNPPLAAAAARYRRTSNGCMRPCGQCGSCSCRVSFVRLGADVERMDIGRDEDAHMCRLDHVGQLFHPFSRIEQHIHHVQHAVVVLGLAVKWRDEFLFGCSTSPAAMRAENPKPSSSLWMVRG